jgi:hypothetical protein
MVAFSRSSNPVLSASGSHHRERELTYIGDFLADRDLDTWTFLLDDRPDNFFMLGGKINRRVNGRYSNGFDVLFSNLRTSTSNLVGIDLRISTPSKAQTMQVAHL